jgi:hypothetical protein
MDVSVILESGVTLAILVAVAINLIGDKSKVALKI